MLVGGTIAKLMKSSKIIQLHIIVLAFLKKKCLYIIATLSFKLPGCGNAKIMTISAH